MVVPSVRPLTSTISWDGPVKYQNEAAASQFAALIRSVKYCRRLSMLKQRSMMQSLTICEQGDE